MTTNTTETSAPAPFVFPPYGHMTETHLSAIREGQFIPSDWRAPDTFSGGVEKHYQWFLDKSLQIIKDTLWPEFAGGKWDGASIPNMLAISEADLDIMLQIQAANAIDQPVRGTGTSTTHRELFENEDKSNDPFGAHLDAYRPPKLNFGLQKRISLLGDKALTRKIANGPLTLKRKLQRPRAYQIAFMLKKGSFIYLEADTACTPSIFSGHCLQGILSIGGIMEALLQSGDDPKPLLQYAVDIGDRRVMAGVHYPSDNLASWIMAMLSADFVFRRPEVKGLLWQAIQLSDVFGRILKSPASVYKPALDALRAIAGT